MCEQSNWSYVQSVCAGQAWIVFESLHMIGVRLWDECGMYVRCGKVDVRNGRVVKNGNR